MICGMLSVCWSYTSYFEDKQDSVFAKVHSLVENRHIIDKYEIFYISKGTYIQGYYRNTEKGIWRHMDVREDIFLKVMARLSKKDKQK